MDCIVRGVVDSDKSFIYNSYLLNCRETYPLNVIPKSIYFPGQQRCIDHILTIGTTLVACFPEDPNEILGYVIFEPGDTPVLHYVYSRRSGRGVFRSLMTAAVGDSKLVVATHVPRRWKKLKELLEPAHVVYDPYNLRDRMVRQ